MKCYDCGLRMWRTSTRRIGAYVYRFYTCRCGLHDVHIG